MRSTGAFSLLLAGAIYTKRRFKKTEQDNQGWVQTNCRKQLSTWMEDPKDFALLRQFYVCAANAILWKENEQLGEEIYVTDS